MTSTITSIRIEIRTEDGGLEQVDINKGHHSLDIALAFLELKGARGSAVQATQVHGAPQRLTQGR